jgi:uncharacterized membrane protein
MQFNVPPLHPILVNFTAALLPVSLVSDLLGVILRKESLKFAGWWTLFYATVITPVTAAAGWYWMRTMGDMDHPEMSVHKWLGTALAVAFVAMAVWRWRIYRSSNTPGVLYLSVASSVVIALVLQGHLGGSMSFGTADNTQSPAGGQPGNSSHDHSVKESYQWRDHIDLKG